MTDLRFIRALVAIALVAVTFSIATPAIAAAPTWLEISGGGLKRPIIVQWEDIAEIRALDWTWAIGCAPSCDPESLLDPKSPWRVDPPLAGHGMPYTLRWKFGPPAAAREWVVAEWRFHLAAADGSGLMELTHHEGMPGWAGMWFAARPVNSDLVTRLLLENGCMRGGGIPCVPIGQEHSFVRMRWAVIR